MDDLLSSIVEQAYTAEFKEYKNSPHHFFSLSHRRRMKQLFNNGTEYSAKSERRHKKKIPAVAVTLIVILSLLITAAGAAYFIHGFGFKKESDHTVVFTTDTGDAPETIVYVYSPTYLPDGFEAETIESYDLTSTHLYRKGNDVIDITQQTKPDFSGNYNTEGYEIERVDINGHEGFKIDFINSRMYVWDNGDYIFDIYSTLPDEEILKIAAGMK